MWARWCEVLVGLWLLASPLAFAFPDGQQAVRALPLTLGAGVVACALLSLRAATRRAHLIGFGLSLLLTGAGWWLRAPGVLVHENHVVSGLVLAMLTLVPSEATRPPRAWREAGDGGHGLPD